MADGEYSTLRNLLLVVVVLLVVSVGSDAYLARTMAENSRVFEKIYALLEGGMSEQMTTALAQAAAIQKELAQAREHAAAATAEMQVLDSRMKQVFKEAEDSFMARLNKELPVIMDRYIESRSAKLRQGVASDEQMRQQIRQEFADIIREEMRRSRPPQQP